MQTDQTRLLALALCEIRVLLANYLGSDVEAPMNVRIAAHMAYALHNEADAVCNNGSFQVDDATLKIAAIDQILGVADGTSLVSRLNAQADAMPDPGVCLK